MADSTRQPLAGNATWDVDPYDEAVLSSPHDYYAELRERGALVWLSRYGIWACGRYEEVRILFSDWRRFCSSRGVGLSDFQTEPPWRPPSIILEADPPEHGRTRAVMMRTLSQHAVNALKQRFRAEADELVDRLLGMGVFDAMPELAEAFPLKVFPDAVGLAEGERENLLIYANMVFNALGPDNGLRRRAMAEGAHIPAWIAGRCARDALAPGGFGAAIYAAADSGEISEEEAGLLVRSLLSAGIDTTVTALGNTLLCFGRYPGQWAGLKRNPDLVRNAFEEVLRFTSPVHSFCRTANVDTEVSGIPIREGDKILCVLASANLDPEHWVQADSFDIERRGRGHVAFGVGIHTCVGRQVARLEAEIVLQSLLERVDRIDLAGQPKWRPGNSMTTLESLPVSFRAA